MKYLLLTVGLFFTLFTNGIAQNNPMLTGWEFSRVDEGIWRPATIPGTVHTDLLAQHLIPDPFVGTNEKAVQWVDKKDWQYRKRWHIKKQELNAEVIELEFKGLDTYADVYLNNHLILQSANMFVSHTVSVKEWLVAGDNELRILFKSPIKTDMPKFLQDSIIYPAGNDASDIPLSIYARKAPYHYGWDWGPRLVTSGIYRPVVLRSWNKAVIRDVYWQQLQLDSTKADMQAEVTIEAAAAGEYTLQVLPAKSTPELAKLPVSLQAGINVIKVPFSIKKPVLWWPAGIGTPFCYELQANLLSNKKVVATQSSKIGLRTIEVVNKPDSLGESFYVKVNGRPVFMKGANYIPQDNFLPRVTKEKQEKLFDDMVTSNFNMVRVWGGGIYEDDNFYRLADQHGILVWQDFMFACTLYPSDPAFLENVKTEAADNIKRLRNHPSLALWCGNNEVAVAIKNWGWQSGYAYTNTQWESLQQGYDKLFKEVLPQQVAAYQPGAFYFHSSPISNWGKPEDFTKGDNHYWGVWHGMEWFEAFNTHVPRFMSEYGFQSFPSMETIRTFAAKEDYDIFSNVMQAHQKSPAKGNTAIKTYMLHYYREPKDFPSFVYLSQVLQAEGMKVAIEAHRRAMPYCMGTLYWQLNDCWPGASWSGRDYDGRWKALQYYVKDAFRPRLVSSVIENGQLCTYLVTDEYQGKADLLMKAVDLNGKVIWQKELTDISVKANTSEKLHAIDTAAVLQGNNPARVIFYAQLRIDSKDMERNIFYFAPAKDMNLEVPHLDVVTSKVAKDKGVVYIRVKTDKLARNVYLSLDKATATDHFEDNYFDLLPGETRTIRLQTGQLPELIHQALKVTTLVSSYKN
ncbi:beta-mannosidase [Chitinophaga ginsengisegetis]|uniref:beta-mannosidase n=1 Tax=Chitinophaga ginsengisegetis TaxID=393003 RepID=UPI000DC02D32|nr:glycoside hydrolase family 2 protein [Chitinophaga ginsengisegetis]MDR6565388.1 beta-mannosidase [Chitinophaga ginsengisegetis]MDR6645116.1 beta-mannosidase [Chitinophaga ginsengisegetis]MDR6652292.1 beta-mannosidase [Chitinophaga ginsengisegetis]